MSKLSKEYLDKIVDLIHRIRDEEESGINQGAKIIADAVQEGNRLFGFGCTHSSLPVQDIIYRAGGLMLVNPIYGPGIASLDVHPNSMTSAIERMTGYAQVLLDNHPIREGDVLIIVSVSGRNSVPIEMSMLAKERGIKVIGITSLKYANGVTSRHASGKKMHDFADVVIDNKAEKGDALMEAEGAPAKFTPASGITSIAILQSLITASIEELLSRGITPPIFIAANVDGGAEHNAKMKELYKDRIFYY
jgi:uncharacterized phosphosugar-binding protein